MLATNLAYSVCFLRTQNYDILHICNCPLININTVLQKENLCAPIIHRGRNRELQQQEMPISLGVLKHKKNSLPQLSFVPCGSQDYVRPSLLWCCPSYGT